MDSNPKTSEQQDGHPSRREFLTRAGILTGGLALLGIPSLRPALTEAAAQRTFATGNFLLELDGQIVETLRSSEGGFPKADVISEPTAPVAKKHIGSLRFENITIACDPIMPKPLFDWVNSTLNMTPARKNGAIITADFNRKEQSRLQFNNALITEIGFPACDASSKERDYLTIQFVPELTTPLAGKGADMSGMLNLKASQKAWLPGNFKLSIPGIDCSKVSKIDAFAIKQKAPQDALGQARDFAKEPGKLEFPNLAISVAETGAGTFYAWFQDMVLKGNSGEQNERVGTLELLDPGMKSVLLTVTFHHLGIFGFKPESADAKQENIRRVKVEMYCEQITLAPGKPV